MRRIFVVLLTIALSFAYVGVFRAAPLRADGGPCVGDGVSGKRIHLWYAWDTEDRYQYFVDAIRGIAIEADAKLAAIGGQHYRFVCSNGAIVVSKVHVAAPTLPAFKYALRAKGYRSTNRIYNAFMPEASEGKGDWARDDRADPTVNSANIGPRYSVQPPNVNLFMHETGHNLGAVQASAPHASGNTHCWDERDIMCYDDGGPYFDRGGRLRLRCGNILDQLSRWDCNLDDYYNPRPAPGSYLATHWNLRNSYFLTPVPTPPPAPRNLRMASSNSYSITMRWDAVSDADGISAYVLEWRRAGREGFGTACETTARSCTLSGSQLWGGRSFEFRVHARDGRGTWGPYSDIAPGRCTTAVCV